MSQKRSYFNLDVTFTEAVKQLETCDPNAIAARAAAEFDSGESRFRLSFIDSNYLVEYPSGRVTMETGENASTYMAIILLHYLVTADGTPLTGQWIAFRHLPGGHIYIDPFNRRAVNPFLKTFGEQPEDFQQAASALGGYQLALSGISIAIPVLPRVPICFILWPGDEEMPASANILFDEAASSYLPTEDYAHLPALVIAAMKEHAS
ncbi:MAG: DUF3786 domain-containing protein [Bacillota bacterium]